MIADIKVSASSSFGQTGAARGRGGTWTGAAPGQGRHLDRGGTTPKKSGATSLTGRLRVYAPA